MKSKITLSLIIHIKLIHDTRGKHLHDRIISQREEIWANKTITAPLCIEAHVPRPASEWSSIWRQVTKTHSHFSINKQKMSLLVVVFLCLRISLEM
jgi:hypothetical protein